MSLATSASIALGHLPLRPSTLVKFQQRGFTNTAEVEKSRRDGGIANLAAELGVSLREATDFYRELQGCVSGTANRPSQLSLNSAIGNGSSFDQRISVSAEGPVRGRLVSRTCKALVVSPRCVPNVQLNSISAKTATEILSTASGYTLPKQPRNLVTFCRSIDSLLGGGMALGEVTEVAGNPGCGKTQLAMQLSVDARLPTEYGGVAGETVYIDTEGSFSPERCYTMAHSLVNHVRKSAEKKIRQHRNRTTPPPAPVPDWFVPETILEGIHLYRAHDEAAQTAIITDLPKFLQERAQLGCPVKLVVVDSIAFHYRVNNHMKDCFRPDFQQCFSLVSFASCSARHQEGITWRGHDLFLQLPLY